MRLLIVALLSVFIASCAMIERFMPAKPKFPDAIKELQQPCPELKTIEGNQVAITELLKAVVENYTLYYDCSLKNEGWNKWYVEQKQIYEKGGKK
jgi:hypothetical protein